MAWGGNHGGKGAREVAAAFYEGRTLKRGNARTDGRTYWLFDHPIARRVPPEDLVEVVTRKLTTGEGPRLLEFSWAGWATATTQAHLDALGVPLAWKGSESQREPRKPELCGKPVDASAWYTLEQAATRPAYVRPPRKSRKPQSVNLTQPMFA